MIRRILFLAAALLLFAGAQAAAIGYFAQIETEAADSP